MICPICQKGRMKEPAPGMLQCAACGNGPSKGRFHWAWSISHIQTTEAEGADYHQGIVIRYEAHRDTYFVAVLEWLTEREVPLATTVESTQVGPLEEDEFGEYTLPVVWLSTPGKLKDKMFKTSHGRKEKI